MPAQQTLTAPAKVAKKAKKIKASKGQSIRVKTSASPALLAKLGFQPIEKIRNLPEYKNAGLHERDTTEYLPSLSINTVEEFLGLIRGATKEIAEDLGTTENSLIDLYNAAVASQLPAMSPQAMDDLLQERFSFGLSLEAPTEAYTLSLAAEPNVEMDIGTGQPSSPHPGKKANAPSASINLIGKHMPPVRDQGDRGTCVAFSTCAVMEYSASRAGRGNQDLSEQYLYWSVKSIDGYAKEGTWLEFAFPVAKKDGTCSEVLWPYEPNVIATDITHGSPPDASACAADALKNAFKRAIRVREHRQPEAIKNHLRQRRPVAVAIPVFKTWYNNPASRLSGKISLPLKSDRFAMGGHAIVLVGYGDDITTPGGGYFIVRNSWGGRWGSESPFTAGYGQLPYAYIERFNADAWTGVV